MNGRDLSAWLTFTFVKLLLMLKDLYRLCFLVTLCNTEDTLHMLQQHRFAVKEPSCETRLPAVQTCHPADNI